MDRNSYYGGESASLNLKQLWERFRPGEPEPTQYGRWQDWNFDMVGLTSFEVHACFSTLEPIYIKRSGAPSSFLGGGATSTGPTTASVEMLSTEEPS
jgi:hypothetical protein